MVRYDSKYEGKRVRVISHEYNCVSDRYGMEGIVHGYQTDNDCCGVFGDKEMNPNWPYQINVLAKDLEIID